MQKYKDMNRLFKCISIMLIVVCILGWLLTFAALFSMMYCFIIGDVWLGFILLPCCLFIGLKSLCWVIDLYDIFHKEESEDTQ